MNMKASKIKIIFILCLVLGIGFMAVSWSFAQEGIAKELELTGYSFNTNTNNMIPVSYGVIVSPRFLDENFSGRYLDPSGESYLESLLVRDKIVMDLDDDGEGRPFILRHDSKDYFINFDDMSSDPDPGAARFRNLSAFKFHMAEMGPASSLDANRGEGKYVWDISEAMLVAEGEPGDVVVISSDEDITLVKSKKKFDRKVAGVISADPKIYMGHAYDEKKTDRYKPLALAGIVLCNVTAENGAIKKGDILVSSSLPGHAMRADPEQATPGMILGRAWGSLDQGQGKIYILVN